jgi:hypothetical protein
MLQSSKDRAKPISVDFVMDFSFRPGAVAALLGSRRRLTSKFYAALILRTAGSDGGHFDEPECERRRVDARRRP